MVRFLSGLPARRIERSRRAILRLLQVDSSTSCKSRIHSSTDLVLDGLSATREQCGSEGSGSNRGTEGFMSDSLTRSIIEDWKDILSFPPNGTALLK